jgi:hypothetical protein
LFGRRARYGDGGSEGLAGPQSQGLRAVAIEVGSPQDTNPRGPQPGGSSFLGPVGPIVSTVPGHAADLARLLALSGDVREAQRLALAARKTAAPDSFAIEVLWRRALALAAAYEGRANEAVQLSDEARARTAASDWLTFHGETLEEAATIQQLAGDASKAARMLHAALATYERKGNVTGAQRVQHRIETGT